MHRLMSSVEPSARVSFQGWCRMSEAELMGFLSRSERFSPDWAAGQYPQCWKWFKIKEASHVGA